MVTRNITCLVIIMLSDEIVKMKFFYYVSIGIYSVWLMAIEIYPDVVKRMYFLLLLLRM